jgi:hypothetical protein
MSNVISTIDEVSARALQQLANPPAAGSGVHQWLFATACLLHEAGYSTTAKLELLEQATRNVGRTVTKREIKGAVSDAEKKTRPIVEEPGKIIRFPGSEPAWPEPDYGHVYLLGKFGPGLYDLWEQSPLRYDDEADHCEEAIDILWPGNPLLCIGKTAYHFATRRREVWRGHLCECQFIVPNPMLQVYGATQEGKKSEHAKVSVGRRCYLVTEFDIAPYSRNGQKITPWKLLIDSWQEQEASVSDACAAAILELAQLMPLALVVHSGGKSLHAWWRVFGKKESESRASMRQAVRLGADPKTFDPNQFVRLPGGALDNGRRQTIFYLDPKEALRDENS